MEQKRILWIVGAVGLFLLVVFGFAFVLYSPDKYGEPQMASVQPVKDVWVANQIEKVTPPSSIYDIDKIDEGYDFPIVDESELVLSLASDEETEKLASAEDTTKTDASVPTTVKDLTVISTNTTVYAGSTMLDLKDDTKKTNESPIVVVQQPIQEPQQIITVKEKVQAPVETKKAVVAKNTEKKETTPTTKAKTAPKKVVEEEKPIINPARFWIQAASYSSKKNADEARKILNEEQIASEIFTYTAKNGDLYYRVRIGPYTTKSEAEYWQQRIALIDTFKNSETYITDTGALAKK